MSTKEIVSGAPKTLFAAEAHGFSRGAEWMRQQAARAAGTAYGGRIADKILKIPLPNDASAAKRGSRGPEASG